MQLEVTKQTEELKRNLALLEEFHKDPVRVAQSLAKVDPSLAAIRPRQESGRGGRGATVALGMGQQVGVSGEGFWNGAAGGRGARWAPGMGQQVGGAPSMGQQVGVNGEGFWNGAAGGCEWGGVQGLFQAAALRH